MSLRADLPCDHGCPAVYDPAILETVPDPLKALRGGRGVPLPDLLDGCSVLVLRAGAGMDCFVLSRLVGPSGRVVGVDDNADVLSLGRQHLPDNVQLVRSDATLPLEDMSMDVVLTNCALSMTGDPAGLLAEVRRVLKPGGELILSEVVSDRRVPRRVQLVRRQSEPCMADALYGQDLRRALRTAGFEDARTLFERKLAERDGKVRWSAVTIRAFAIPLEDQCEDYGQMVCYLGTIPGSPGEFMLDGGHVFRTDEMVAVCKNTADMINQSRYAPHFEVTKERLHQGLFDCSGGATNEEEPAACAGAGCC